MAGDQTGMPNTPIGIRADIMAIFAAFIIYASIGGSHEARFVDAAQDGVVAICGSQAFRVLRLARGALEDGFAVDVGLDDAVPVALRRLPGRVVAVVALNIQLYCQGDLLEVALAHGEAPLLAHTIKDRRQNGREQRNDGENNEDSYKREFTRAELHIRSV